MMVLQFAVKLSEQIIPIMSQVFLVEQVCVCKAWQDLDKRLSNYDCFRPSKKIRYTGMDIIILSEIAAFLFEPIFFAPVFMGMRRKKLQWLFYAIFILDSLEIYNLVVYD